MMALAQKKSAKADKIFLEVLSGKKSLRAPFWFMRQAGRYLPEYRALREKKGGFLAMAMDPEAACEITLQPIRRFGMDAAIIFSDILTVPYALGQDLKFEAGEGPKLGTLDLEKLCFDEFAEKLQPVYDALSLTRNTLDKEGFANTALIGFAGAPWTVATYMVEGGGSKDFANVKKMAYGDAKNFQRLIDLLVDATSRYLIRQIEAGAEAIQIFDSWAGALDPDQFLKYSLAPVKKIIANLKSAHPDIPVIAFPRGAGIGYLDYARESGADALGLDTGICTRWAAENLQKKIPVQGNLDPICLLAGGPALEERAKKILTDLSGGPFIFNLGHGIQKDTPVENVEKLVKIIRDFA